MLVWYSILLVLYIDEIVKEQKQLSSERFKQHCIFFFKQLDYSVFKAKYL